MRTHKLIAVTVALGLVAAAPVADAATKPKPKPAKRYCDLLTDAKGDGHSTTASQISSPSLDIIGADFASGPTTVVAVLRVASLNTNVASDPFVATGYDWRFLVDSSLGQTYAFTAKVNSTTPISGTASVDSQDVGSAVTFTTAGNTMVWTLKRSASPHLGRPKNVFSNFRASDNALSISADRAPETGTTPGSYPDRALSCVLAK